MKNKNILVTGADGFIGSHLCEKLVHKGHNIKALVAYNSFENIGWLSDIAKNKLDNIEIISGDIRDSDFIYKITKNIDIIYHLAALIAIPYSYIAPRSYIDTNVIGTLNILQGAKQNSCSKIISTSTSEVYGTAQYEPIDENHVLQAQSPYAASKIAADHLLESFVKSFSLPAVIIRPFNTYGPRQSERAVIPTIIRQIIDPKCKEIRIGDTSPKRDFNFVEDTVDAFIEISKTDNSIIKFGTAYNAGSGIAVSIQETLNLLNKISKNKKPIKKDKNRLRPSKSEVKNLIACSKKLSSVSKWRPKTTLNKGLEITIEWWKKQLKDNKIRNNSNYSI